MRVTLTALFPLFLICISLGAQPYDLLLKGGYLIDSKNEINEPRDVAIAAGKIARVSHNILAKQAKKLIDVTGFYVKPGFVGLHTHIVIESRLKAILFI